MVLDLAWGLDMMVVGGERVTYTPKFCLSMHASFIKADIVSMTRETIGL